MTPTDLRAWRHRMGYTQTQAARAMGVSLSSYAKIECGMRPIKAYHVKLAEFLEARAENAELKVALAGLMSRGAVLSCLEDEDREHLTRLTMARPPAGT